MNITIDNSPDCLQESFRLMLMTLEYGGSVNTKALDELEQKIKESNCELSSMLNN